VSAPLKHPPAPRFCAECEQALLETIQPGRREHAGYCSHRQTLAQVSLEPDGTIRAWRLRSPLSEEAAVLMVQMSASMKEEIFSRSQRGHGDKKKH